MCNSVDCFSSRSDKVQRREPGEEGYDPYEYDDEGIDVGNEFCSLLHVHLCKY